MPHKANEARRHKIPRARYRVTNWPDYDRALQQRGSLTVWVTPEALAAWHPPKTGQRGRSPQYADLAIETGHLLRLAFGRPWRQTEGLLRSLTALLGVSVGVPDHTTTFMWTAWARQWGSISRGFFVPGRASVAASWGGSGQVRPYVRPVARRMPLATMGVRLRARHQSLSRALEAQRRVRYCLDCFVLART